jgi:hypothetical protein
MKVTRISGEVADRVCESALKALYATFDFFDKTVGAKR